MMAFRKMNSLKYAPFETANHAVPADGRLTLVFIEPRILQPITGLTTADDLLPRFERWKGDLRAEGLFSRLILAEPVRFGTRRPGAWIHETSGRRQIARRQQV